MKHSDHMDFEIMPIRLTQEDTMGSREQTLRFPTPEVTMTQRKVPHHDRRKRGQKGGLGTCIHPNSPADTTRPKTGERGDNAVPLHVGGT